MTQTTNARLAGFMFLFYIATGIAAMILFQPVDGAVGTAAKLASIAEHAPRVRLTILLSLLTVVEALVLAVALYAITRDHDPDLAMLALSCRIGEGLLGAIGIVATLGLLWLGTAAAAIGPEAAAANALAALLLRARVWSLGIGGTLFAVGDTLYSYLFLQARSIPLQLGQMGIFASVLLVLFLPAQLVGFIQGPANDLVWMPMLVFEVGLGLWLLIKGGAVRATRRDLPAFI
jgi:hypothetical protein